MYKNISLQLTEEELGSLSWFSYHFPLFWNPVADKKLPFDDSFYYFQSHIAECRENVTEVTESIFLGFSSFENHQITLFVVFLTIYFLTLAGHIIIVTITCTDLHLQTSMYFFLSMVASSEVVYPLVIVPLVFLGLIFHNQPVSLEGCATQIFFFFLSLWPLTIASCSPLCDHL